MTGGINTNGLAVENHGNTTYLVYEVGSEEAVDSTSLSMLTNNRISGLAQTIFTQWNDKKYIKYNISGKISLEQLFSRTIKRKPFLEVLSGIVEALMSAEDYLLDADSILLEYKSIYFDISSYESALICLPIAEKRWDTPDLTQFFRNIMANIQFDFSENCDYVARILNFLNHSGSVSIPEFSSLLKTLKSEKGSGNESGLVRGREKAQSPLTVPAECRAPEELKADPSAAAEFPAKPAVHTAAPPPPPGRAVPPSAPAEAAPVQASGTEKEISLFYLLQHYNKENAAAYKAQKARKKKEKNGGRPEINMPPKQERAGAPAVAPSFSIPGQAPAVPRLPEETPPGPRLIEERQAAGYAESPSVMAAQAAVLLEEQKMDFGDTDFAALEDDEDTGTVIMGQEHEAQRIMPHLLRRRNNERIPINKPIFRLGRDADFNDYAVTENKYVGHSHCHLISRDGEFFNVDDNSKNHTYVNGEQIPSGREIKLTHGTTACVADEEFEFRLF